MIALEIRWVFNLAQFFMVNADRKVVQTLMMAAQIVVRTQILLLHGLGDSLKSFIDHSIFFIIGGVRLIAAVIECFKLSH